MITIGKANDNEYVVNDPSVSRHHAQLTYEEEGHWILEDLGSTNGTFVNGIQIARKQVTSKDVIKLGNSYVLDLAEVLKANNDYSEEFAALKQVYDNYIQAKIKIQSSNQFKTRLLQSLPFALPGIIGVLIGSPGKEVRHCSPSVCLLRFAHRQSVSIGELNNRPKYPSCCKI